MLDGNNEKNSLIEEDGSQNPSLEEISKVKADENVSTVTQEKHEETLVMEEVPTESMQVSDEDIKASTLVQDRESSLEEQSLNTKSQGIMDDNAYRTNDATHMEKESQEDNNAATTTSYEDNEVNPQIQGDVSQLEQNEHIEKESENAPLTEGRARDTVENTLSKEEAEMEKPTDYVEVATEDMKASASSQDTETSTIVAAYSKEKTLEDVATKIPSWDNDDNLPIEMNGSLNPSLKEAVMGNTNDDESTNIHAKFEDDNLTKDGSFEDEKKKECTSIEKEVFSEPLQEADEDIKACTSCQDRETTFLEEQGSTMNSHRIEGDNEEKTSYVTNLKEETPDIKNAATTIPHENAEESSPSQVDSSQMEQKEHFEIKRENTSLTEKPTGDTIESTLKEEAHMEKPIAGFQMAIGDIEGSASRQDTVMNSKEAQVPPTDPQETSLDKTEGKITDASYAQEDESALKEASTGNVIDILSPIMHEVKFENEHSIKADLIGKEKCTEHISVNEKTSVESCSVEVQGLITDSKENTSKHKEDRTIDAAELEHETPQDKNIALTTTYKEAEGISLIQTDCFQIEHGEHVEKKSGNPSLTDAQTGDITGSTLLKEESDMQRLIDSVQVSPENIHACTSIHDTETRSIEDRILAVDPQEILCDQTKEKTVDVTDTNEETLEVQEIAINVPIGKKEDNSPTKVDGSQEPSEASAENTAHHESFIDTDVVENEKSTVGTLIKEETSIESLQITEDIKACASGQDKEPSSQEKHSLVANSGEIIANKREDKTIDATNLKEETSKEKASKSIAVQIPSPNDSDVNTDTVLDIAEDPNRKQEKSSIIATESEEHMMTNNAHVANAISTTSEPSEQCIDKTDTEKMTVLNDGSAKVSTNENLVKTDPAESMEAGAQVPDEENKPESEQQDTEALEDILSSNVVSETNLTLNPVLESGKETQPEASNEEAQKQDEDLHISASVPDSSIQKLEKDVVSCPASAVDYGISPDENATKYTDCKEREVAGDANNSFSNDKILTEREQEETECKQEKALSVETVEEIKEPTSIPVANDLLPKSFIGTSGIDHSTTERQLSINEDPQTEKTPTGNNEDRKHDEDENKEEGERKISEFSPAALNIIEAGDKDGANTSLADLDDEAPEIIQRAPSATESREVENTSVGETSALISQCERDDSEHVHIDTEKKPDSNEVGFAPEESKSGHESKNQMLEYGTISKAGENLEATTTEIISETGKVNFSSEKIKEEDEDVRNDHLGSCKEAITESHLEDHAKQEKKTNTEEIIKVMKIPNETAKVSNDSEHAVDRAGDETREKLQVNSSTAAFLDDGDKSKGADENIICEAPPTNTIYTTIEDTEGKKENANTIMMQHKAEDTKSNLETSPVHEFTRGIESEKQAKKDETCSLDEVQMKDEVNLMHPARKGEAEATKAEDEDKNTYDRTEVSSGGDIHDAQEDNDNSTTKNRYCEEKCPNENREARVPTEGQEEEAIPKGPVLEQETEERKLEMTSQAVTKANAVDSQEAKIIDDESHVRAASENISVPNIHQSSTEDPAQSDENQKQIGSSPISPVTRCSDDEIAEKDLPPQFAGLDSTGGTELQVTPTPSEDKHIVPEADHTNSMNPENTIGNSNIPSIDHGSSTECSQGEHELLKNPALEHKETAGQETTKSAEKTESKDIDKPSPSDLFQVSTKGTSQEAAPHIEHLRAEKAGEAELEDTKTNEDGGEEEEPSEQILSEVCAEAPIMVDAADAEVKAAAHKKSHNILSGVGSKVKHSIAKVKKAITGKSSHPKPPSPK